MPQEEYPCCICTFPPNKECLSQCLEICKMELLTKFSRNRNGGRVPTAKNNIDTSLKVQTCVKVSRIKRGRVKYCHKSTFDRPCDVTYFLLARLLASSRSEHRKRAPKPIITPIITRNRITTESIII